MGEMDVNPNAVAGTSGWDVPTAMREAFTVLYGVPGAGPTGVWSRSQ